MAERQVSRHLRGECASFHSAAQELKITSLNSNHRPYGSTVERLLRKQ